MRRSKPLLAKVVLFLAMTGGVAAALHLGIVPPRANPFAPLDLSEPDSWFLDFRLAALKTDAARCRTVLTGPAIAAEPVRDDPIMNGCGWQNAVHVSRTGGTHLAANKMTCEMAAALALWVQHAVEPAARRLLQADVRSIHHMGTYACRNIAGNPLWRQFRSQHATANAIDIEGFMLSDGRTVSVARHWKGSGPEAAFLRDVHDAACRYFRVALGPDFNAAHANHFHLDRGVYRSCR